MRPNSKMTPTQRKNSSEFPSLRQKRRSDGDWKEIFCRVDIQMRFNVNSETILPLSRHPIPIQCRLENFFRPSRHQSDHLPTKTKRSAWPHRAKRLLKVRRKKKVGGSPLFNDRITPSLRCGTLAHGSRLHGFRRYPFLSNQS